MTGPYVVIGANYGDEGKGLMVDYLVRATNAKIVVRHNGGAQAGHTVVLPDGRRHVFKHFGAGTLAGAATYLAERFVCNPILFQQELKELRAFGLAFSLRPAVCVHANAVVTTPWDMALNQAVERYRIRVTGAGHGSVGVGINETVRRSQYDRHALHAGDLVNLAAATLLDRYKGIATHWLTYRLRELGVPLDAPEAVKLIEYGRNEEVMYGFYTDAEAFTSNIQIIYNDASMLANNVVVFEGAQGLALDQNSPDYPHVTRSNTGLTNIMQICAAAGLEKPRVTYVTRNYLTRHGAGPLPRENAVGNVAAFRNVVDTTNVPHDWQGSLRFAPLDALAMSRRIAADVAPYMDQIESYNLAVTHTDQLGNWAPKAVLIAGAAGMSLGYESNGPTHEHVKEY